MTLRRYRCHAAICSGAVTTPALVTIYPSGQAEIAPYTAETFGTIDYNGVIVMAPPGTELPPAVSRDRIKARLRDLAIPPASADTMIAHMIPLA